MIFDGHLADLHASGHLGVKTFVEALCALGPELGSAAQVHKLLQKISLDLEAFKKRCYWQPGRYTRSKLFRSKDFELIGVGWAPGSATPVHNHDGQHCWLLVLEGSLESETFAPKAGKLVRTGSLETIPTGGFDYRGPDGDATIHQVRNVGSLGQNALSLHLYAKPIDRCTAYDPPNLEGKVRLLTYDQEDQESERDLSSP